MVENHLWFAFFICYVSSTLGVFGKLWRGGVRGKVLLTSFWFPLVILIFPVLMLLTIYVPGFNKELYPMISTFRKFPGRKYSFPFWTVMVSVQSIPLFTSITAKSIYENQKHHVKIDKVNFWIQTTREMVPYMTMRLGTHLRKIS